MKISLRFAFNSMIVGGSLLLAAAPVFLPSAEAQQGNVRVYSTTPTPVKVSTPLPTATPPVTPTPQTMPSPGEVIEDEGDVIRVDTDLVTLNVRLVDRAGKTYNGVRADKSEFEVYENNVLQPIDFVSREEVPINYGLLVDNSGSLRSQLQSVIDAGKTIVASNKPRDESFVIRFVGSDNIKILQDFTNSKTDLNDALDSMFADGGSTALYDAIYLAAEKTAEYEKSLKLEDRTRRALVLVTDGEDLNSYYSEKQLFDFLRESDVQIYVIGFVNELDDDKSLFGKSSRKKSIDFLERLTKTTGGKAYYPKSLSEMPEIAKDIATELRTQYVISYSPTDDRRDGKFRSIRVAVRDDKNRGKIIALTRSGRTAPLVAPTKPVSK